LGDELKKKLLGIQKMERPNKSPSFRDRKTLQIGKSGNVSPSASNFFNLKKMESPKKAIIP
jgi:hypothetical protein